MIDQAQRRGQAVGVARLPALQSDGWPKVRERDRLGGRRIEIVNPDWRDRAGRASFNVCFKRNALNTSIALGFDVAR